jgi:alpha-tubulin suppressor-like RCC1 family protein
LTFRQIDAGRDHTCAVSSADLAFCWGRNDRGQIGDSSKVVVRPAPIRVSGGRRYAQISAGDRLTCAVTVGSRAFCWGDGSAGGLGNGKTI